MLLRTSLLCNYWWIWTSTSDSYGLVWPCLGWIEVEN